MRIGIRSAVIALLIFSCLYAEQPVKRSIASQLASAKIGMTIKELEMACGKASFEIDRGDGTKLVQFMGNSETDGPLIGFGATISDGRIIRISPMFRAHPIMSGDGRIIGEIPPHNLWKNTPTHLIEAIELRGELAKISDRDLYVIANVVVAALSGISEAEQLRMTVSSECSLVRTLQFKHRNKLTGIDTGRIRLDVLLRLLRSIGGER